MVGRLPKNSWLFAVLIACAIWTVPVLARADGLNISGALRAVWTEASVQDSGDLRERLFSRGRREQAIGLFTSEGGPSFVLDESGRMPLLRYQGSSEIWVLRQTAGVRGDIYYRNDVGEVVLRATRLGGLTLYTAGAPGGLPCAFDNRSEALRLREHDAQSLFRHLLREAARGGIAVRGSSSRRVGLEISALEVDDDSSSIVGDTATVAVDAIARLSSQAAGREQLSSLRVISIDLGDRPNVRRDGSRLIVTIVPRLGPAGRPSSARVMRALS